MYYVIKIVHSHKLFIYIKLGLHEDICPEDDAMSRQEQGHAGPHHQQQQQVQTTLPALVL